MSNNSTITITFGDQAENHVGMEKIGVAANNGINMDDIVNFKYAFESLGAETELYLLNDLLPNEIEKPVEEAYIFIVRNGINKLFEHKLKYNADDLFNELSNLRPDTKALMYGRVVNKHARHNLCFADYERSSDFSSGKGTIINFNSVPLTNYVRKSLYIMGGDKFHNLMGEANYYYDIKKCGIGFHGDSERKIVIAYRVGESLPLQYQWYYKKKPVGNRTEFMLNHGDIYFMSEKAVGTDWKKSSIYTLRHAAGCKKYLQVKKK